ncbi:MAG: exodeoxyribonuclease VII large subunit, partial [Gammaproteobacteria bacterium]|nr:exodeoxyribonuclease VII large subunit [Gammaproteobacteria bacterium]
MNQVITSDTFRRDVYTVTRLNTEARAVLEATFPAIWIEGELSNFAHPRSGHMYFSLKDEQAQVRCAMFRQNNRQLDFKPQDGSQVLARGRVGLYRDRGDFQLVIEYMELAGDGALRRAFEALKQRLSAEGLFADERKQALPSLPSRVGVVTSATGAALRDVLNVLARRFPGLPVVIYPTLVQGEAASRAIATAIETADQRGECDVLLLVRGGGSLEDLWAFNEETTARAIAQCTIPIVAGVGHETDFTIADLVADHRAPTPSAAAELISPDQYELHERLDALDARLLSWIRGRLRTGNRDLELTAKRLQHPRVGLAR